MVEEGNPSWSTRALIGKPLQRLPKINLFL